MSMAMLVVVIALSVVFDFINGFHDTANSIATSVSTRVLSPGVATLMSAGLNFLGALISAKVAETIASGIVNKPLPAIVIAASLCGAIVWNLFTWYIALPSSSSHALIGSMVGAAIVETGSLSVVNWTNILDKVIIPLFSSPVIGFVIGYCVMKLLFFILRQRKTAGSQPLVLQTADLLRRADGIFARQQRRAENDGHHCDGARQRRHHHPAGRNSALGQDCLCAGNGLAAPRWAGGALSRPSA